MQKMILALTLLLLPLASFAQENYQSPHFYTTYHQPTGNRFIGGSGSFPNVTAQDYDLPGIPNWVIGTESGWVVTTEDGRVWNIRQDVTQRPETLPSGTPPAAYIAALPDNPMPLMTTPPGIAPYTHAVQVSQYLVFVAENGDLVALYGEQPQEIRLPLNIQPDARIVISEDQRIALYAHATDQRYVHGIMGDDLEGAALVVLRIVENQFVVQVRVDLPGDAVYEGLSPLWADVNQDGTQDLVTTVSDSEVGSRIRVYLSEDETFSPVAGDAIGQPYRWQHQLAWGAFGAEGEMELIEVRTPHLGGVVRFYRYSENGLEIVASVDGYTSHIIGSRNLDMAVAGDLNGDGQPEIVLPSQDRTRIAGIQRNPNGASVIWELPLEGTAVSNLAAAYLENGLALAVGTEDGRLRVWTR